MDKELAKRIFMKGQLIEREGKVDELQPEDQIVVALDGKLYVLTIEEVS